MPKDMTGITLLPRGSRAIATVLEKTPTTRFPFQDSGILQGAARSKLLAVLPAEACSIARTEETASPRSAITCKRGAGHPKKSARFIFTSTRRPAHETEA